MAPRKTFGRIVFPGNPWPAGHAVTKCVWTARVERGTGIWFDLDLETEEYYAADGAGGEAGEDDRDDVTEWATKGAWNNYHMCILSSTRWSGHGQGFLVATKAARLDMKALPKMTFRFDPPPVDFSPPRPFHIYLLGHDAVSDHQIAFARERQKPTWSIDWRGRIALFYSGSKEFNYGFNVKLSGIRFGGIVDFPAGTDCSGAMDSVEPFIANRSAWQARRQPDGRVRVVPKMKK